MCNFTFYELDEDRKNTYFSTITGAFIMKNFHIFTATGIKISLHQKQDRFSAKDLPNSENFSTGV